MQKKLLPPPRNESPFESSPADALRPRKNAWRYSKMHSIQNPMRRGFLEWLIATQILFLGQLHVVWKQQLQHSYSRLTVKAISKKLDLGSIPCAFWSESCCELSWMKKSWFLTCIWAIPWHLSNCLLRLQTALRDAVSPFAQCKEQPQL